MTIDKSTWQAASKSIFKDAGAWLKRMAGEGLPYTVYSATAAMTLWPVVDAAINVSQFYPAVGALYSLASGVGANLVAEQLSRWKDQVADGQPGPTPETVQAWLSAVITETPEVRDPYCHT